jgi:hypothetical protein
MMDQFNTTFVRVTLLAFVFAFAYGLLAFACFRFPKGKAAPARGVSRAKVDEPVTLIVGQGGARTE